MKEKMLIPGDRVSLKTRSKTWQGYVLPSHDTEVVLLKLKSGYNIGIRESEILKVTVLEKGKGVKKEEFVPEKKVGLRNVAIIMTGGTISSRLDPKSGGVIHTDVDEILKIAPGLRDICNVVRIVNPFMKFSENMSFKDWKKLAEISEKLLNDDGIDGLIITHGTDFLHYTSAALSFFLRDLNKPVALTYSQRSIDRGSTDASLNLVCAAHFAVSDLAEVALVGHQDSNDEFCLAFPGTKVRKMHTSIRGAFTCVNAGPLARISRDTFTILDMFTTRDNVRKVKVDSSYEDKIVVIKVFPGQDPCILDYYIGLGYKGVILEIAGIGQVPASDSSGNWLPKIRKAVKSGVFVGAVPQTIFGRLNPKVYSAGRDLERTGIVFLQDMLSETALVKLGWVLGHKKWDVKEKMLENISREFSEVLQ